MKDTRIYLAMATVPEYDRHVATGKMITIIDVGIGNNTLKNYILPSDLRDVGKFYYDKDVGMNYIKAAEDIENTVDSQYKKE